MWGFTQGTWSLHHPRWPSHSFCEQVSHRHRDTACQHWEGTPSHCVWLWEVPHLFVGKNIHSWNRPQTALEMISMKNLIAAPARLQRMLPQLQQYNMTIMYRPGKEMLLADALSHLPSWTDTQIQLNLKSWCHIHFSLHKEPPDQDCSRNTMRSNPVNSTQIDTEWWAQQMHKTSPESPETTGTSEMNFQSRMIYSWKVNELSSHHPAETTIMDNLNKSHTGINKALALARMCVSIGKG